jgi:hypothetical protein
MPVVTSVWPDWIATRPLNRWPEDKYRPEAQHAASSEDGYAQPVDGIGVNRPEIEAICVGRQKAAQETHHGEYGNNPAVAAILAYAAAYVSAGEHRNQSHRQGYDCKDDSRRIREESGPAPQPRIAKPRYAAVLRTISRNLAAKPIVHFA